MTFSRLLWLTSANLMAFALAANLRADDKPLRELIDTELTPVWQRENITPATKSTDAAFLRRVHLDLVGTIPTFDETKAFLDDTDPQKRQKLIDRLLADPRWAAHETDVWDLLLFGRNPPGGDITRNRESFRKWLGEKFSQNEPFDRLVKSLLLAEEDGSSMFYVQFRSQPEEAAVAVSRLFLGTQLQCARCHDHPYEKWTQRDFYGMAAFFARLVVVDGNGTDGKKRYFIGEKSTGDVLFSGQAKDQKPGKKGEPIKPKFLLGDGLEEPELPKDFKEPELKPGQAPPKPQFSRKEKLAEWLPTPENRFFTRAVANRTWAQLMGRGLVHPVDDLRDKNKPSHPALFQAMTEQLASHKYDLKWLMREIASSEAYQLGGEGKSTAALPEWFERARVRPLSMEELLSAFRVATGFDDAAHAAGEKPGQEKLPGAIREYMVQYFGEPYDGQGDFQGGLSEHLFLNNSEQLRQMIQPRKGNLADAILKSNATAEEKVDRMFLSILSRAPREAEKKKFVSHLMTQGVKPEPLVEEAIWALLNTSEFRFNH